MAGWALYVDEGGIPTYLYNWFGHELTFVRGADAIPPGEHELAVDYAHDGGFAKSGMASLRLDGIVVAEARIERTVPVIFSMSGETFDVGRNTGSPVGPYPHGFPFNGTITSVTLERLSQPGEDVRKQEARGRFVAGVSSQ